MLNGVMTIRELSDISNINYQTLKFCCIRKSHNLTYGIDFIKSGNIYLVSESGANKLLSKINRNKKYKTVKKRGS